MSYQVTARKWRPLVFDDVVGQNHVTNTLRNAIASKRVAHAYIFSGTRGCGKTTTARILARALNCLSPVNQNPDNTCEICKEIIEGRSLDVIEIDGASNRGVEEIRNLRDSVRYTPAHGSYKIYIIDEVHMLTKEAFNALLKTLEEPPAHVIFIFATTEVHKVPMTILSRCQRFDFRRIAVEEIIKTLATIAKAESITIDEEALMVIAKRADGSLRDAQSIFDQVRSFCGTEIKADELLKAFNVVDQDIYFRVTDILKNHNVKDAIRIIDEVIKSGYDLREFTSGLAEHLRNLLIVTSTGSAQMIEVSEHYKKKYEAAVKQFSEQDILRYIKQTNELEQTLKWAVQPRYRLEAGLIQMVKMDDSLQIGELLRQIELLKKKISDKNSSDLKNQQNPARHEDPHSSGIKVMGEVGAGYLSSKAAVSYSSLIGVDLMKVAGIPKTLNPEHVAQRFAAEETVNQSISSEEIVARWPDFISDVAKTHIAVSTLLTEIKVLDVQGGTVRISCPDMYHFSTVKRHRNFLVNALNQVIGKNIAIEPVLHSSKDIPVKSVFMTSSQLEDAKNSTENRISDNNQVVEHPVLSMLKRELGAERIE
ncbi:MAG: DNA polymerase III subunit gamma/tau [Bacteroidetes bacterium]|nr:DNA polymerase III subunit gamma/tau [Bacteroidota bacterium]